MQGFKCNVTGASPTAKPLAKAQIPVYCENEPEKCVKGAKQMLAAYQAEGNNIETPQWVTPNYNQKCGWAEGAQKDIFEGEPVKGDVPVSSSPTSTASSVVTPSNVASSSTLATRVTIAPTSVVEVVSIASVPAASAAVPAVSTTSCTARRPRYTPWHHGH